MSHSGGGLEALQRVTAEHARAAALEQAARERLYAEVREQVARNALPELVAAKVTGLNRATIRRAAWGPAGQAPPTTTEPVDRSQVVRDAVIRLADDAGRSGLVWEGPLADLYRLLGDREAWSDWPRDAAQFGRRLALAADDLETEGITVERTRSAKERRVTLTSAEPAT